MSLLLEVKHVSKSFEGARAGWFKKKTPLWAVDDVSFSLNTGETLGIVGESGCGKSTLAKTILRLYEADSGSVVFDTRNLRDLGTKSLRKMRRQMQIVFQDPYSSLNPRMNVREILSEPFLIHRIGTKKEISTKIEELVQLVGLSPDCLSRFPHEFSGGQRQRIGIARAIALRPKLVVADEPVSALDVSVQSQILNLLVDLKNKLGLSYIFISHDLAVIEHISDRVAVMYLGKIVEMGDRDQIFNRPKHPYTKALLASLPSLTQTKREKFPIKGELPSLSQRPNGCHFHPRCPIVKDTCRETAPRLEDKGSSQLVSCHFAT